MKIYHLLFLFAIFHSQAAFEEEPTWQNTRYPQAILEEGAAVMGVVVGPPQADLGRFPGAQAELIPTVRAIQVPSCLELVLASSLSVALSGGDFLVFTKLLSSTLGVKFHTKGRCSLKVFPSVLFWAWQKGLTGSQLYIPLICSIIPGVTTPTIYIAGTSISAELDVLYRIALYYFGLGNEPYLAEFMGIATFLAMPTLPGNMIFDFSKRHMFSLAGVLALSLPQTYALMRVADFSDLPTLASLSLYGVVMALILLEVSLS
jgi:hypothetical protein